MSIELVVAWTCGNAGSELVPGFTASGDASSPFSFSLEKTSDVTSPVVAGPSLRLRVQCDPVAVPTTTAVPTKVLTCPLLMPNHVLHVDQRLVGYGLLDQIRRSGVEVDCQLVLQVDYQLALQERSG